MTTAAPDNPAPKRPWWRLHFSTVLVAALVSALLVLLIVPGSTAYDADIEHGWPWTLGASEIPLRFLDDNTPDAWLWTAPEFEYNRAALLGDVGVAAAIVLAAAVLWERRRRRVRRAWHFRLSELLLLITAAAAFGGWWVSWQTQERRQHAALDVLQSSNVLIAERWSWEQEPTYAGPRWLAHFVGASRLPTMFWPERRRYLDIAPQADHDRLRAALADMDTLETVWLMGAGVDDAWLACVAELPRMTTLSLWNTSVTERGLAQLARSRRLRSLRILADDDSIGADERARLGFLAHAQMTAVLYSALIQRLRQALPGVEVVVIH